MMSDPADDFRPSVLRARQILEHQVKGTPVEQVDARIRDLERQGLHQRARNLLRARIAAHGEPLGLQNTLAEPKKDAS